MLLRSASSYSSYTLNAVNYLRAIMISITMVDIQGFAFFINTVTRYKAQK
jgi:hypothetical protein